VEAGPPTPPGGQPSPAPPPTGSQPALAVETPEARIEGLRAWIAQVDRRLGIRTYAGGAAVVLALAAGIVGVVLATSAKDESATKDEVQALRNEVETGQQQAVSAAEDEIAALDKELEALKSRVSGIASQQRTGATELTVVQDDIEDLRTDISDLRTDLRSSAASNNGSPPDQ